MQTAGQGGQQGSGAGSGEAATGDNGKAFSEALSRADSGSARGDGSNNARGDSAGGPSSLTAASRGGEAQSGQSARGSQGGVSVQRALVQVAREGAQGQKEVRMRLNPPHLGDMRVEFQMQDNKAQLVFHVDNRQAAAQLDQQMQTLRQALQDQQIDLDDVQVQVGGEDSPGAQDQGEEGDEQQDGSQRGQGVALEGDGAGEAAGAEGEPVNIINGGLSLYA
jgi:flagellar hook-length control protein FliK